MSKPEGHDYIGYVAAIYRRNLKKVMLEYLDAAERLHCAEMEVVDDEDYDLCYRSHREHIPLYFRATRFRIAGYFKFALCGHLSLTPPLKIVREERAKRRAERVFQTETAVEVINRTMCKECLLKRRYITIPEEYKSYIQNVGRNDFSTISGIPLPTISLFLRKGRVIPRTWEKLVSALPRSVRRPILEPEPEKPKPVPVEMEIPERTRILGPDIKVRVVVDGHEGERPTWALSVVNEFTRCLRSCRATGRCPTVRNITDRFKRPSCAEVQEDAGYRPFWLAYGRYIVDDVSHSGRAVMIFVRRKSR